jgi:inner membrane protein
MKEQGATLTARVPNRSMGLKLLLVCALALLMTIPALFVFGLLNGRTHRAADVTAELGGLMGGPQTFLGPVIAVPYVAPVVVKEDGKPDRVSSERNLWVIFPTKASAEVSTRSEIRKRSLFRVPVYTADVAWKAGFDLTEAGKNAPAGAVFDWSRAEFLVGASDARGARADVILASAGGKPVTLSPAVLLPELELARTDGSPDRNGGANGLKLFGVTAAPVATPGAVFETTGSLRFTGASRIAVLAYGKSTDVTVKGDWNSPSFVGSFLPAQRSVAGGGEGAAALAKGFSAHWNVPFVARGAPAEGGTDALSRLGQTEMAVAFVEPANPYQSVERSLKYALLFVGLVFLAYFMFEVTTGKKIHAAQYVLIGLAQIIFYLLLLSIAEHLGFDLAFLIAAGATVALISAYAGWVFESRSQGVRALVAFTLLYALIYVLMRLEDYALLVGALASFAAIALVMFFTRRIDWYGAQSQNSPVPVSEEKA